MWNAAFKTAVEYSTGTLEYSTELAFNSNLPNITVLNVAFYMHIIRQLYSAHALWLNEMQHTIRKLYSMDHKGP